jgi:2-methylcitrate dehydratase PrpD
VFNKKKNVSQFINRKASITDYPDEVVVAVKEALIDFIGASIAGSRANVSNIVREFALEQWGAGKSSLIMSEQKLTPSGAALVNATLANALDIDDGHRLTKGHPGAAVIPAVLAAAESMNSTGEDFLTSLLVGYEVGIRAGIIAHQMRPEYHCTGSWGALGAAAGSAKILKLGQPAVEHALGIAEYHATYSPMMRCISEPSMLKDGISWGSMTGLSASLLASKGFTGISSLFSSTEAEGLVNELGDSYRIQQLYFKPHACCRWAQPAVEGVKYLYNRFNNLDHRQIERLTIHTFKESAALSVKKPTNTEEAQYNLAFPVAAYCVFGEIGPNQVLVELNNKSVLELMDKIDIQIDSEINNHFPVKALSRVEIIVSNGDKYVSPIMQARGDFDFPLTKEEKLHKYKWLASPLLGMKKCEAILEMVDHLEEIDEINELSKLFR